MAEKKKFYLTTAIAYTSGKPHIGNTYEAVLADSIVRFKRQQGYDVRFQTGTDEHGQKIEIKSQEAGITPKQFVDHMTNLYAQQMNTTRNRYRKFLKNCTARGIYIKAFMKACIVLLVNLSSHLHSL